jgi:hypothetical protein
MFAIVASAFLSSSLLPFPLGQGLLGQERFDVFYDRLSLRGGRVFYDDLSELTIRWGQRRMALS